MMNALPAEAEALIPMIRDEWIEKGMATGPVDREAAQDVMSQIYRLMGIEPPRLWIWMGSPFAGALAASMLTRARLRETPYIGTYSPLSLRRQATQLASGQLTPQDWLRELFFASPRDRLLDPSLEPLADQVGRDLRAQIKAQAGHPLRLDIGHVLPASSDWWVKNGKVMPHAIRKIFYKPDIEDLFRDVSRRLQGGPADSLWGEVYHQIRYQLRYEFWPIGYGQFDSTELAAFDFFRRTVLSGVEGMEPYLRLSEVTGWWWVLTNACIMTERPIALHRNGAGWLHCETGPALLYPDGWGIHAWHGVRIPGWLVEDKHRLTPERIEAEDNADLRSIMLEIFGFGRYIAARGAALIARDEQQGAERQLYDITVRDERVRILRLTEDGPQQKDRGRDRYVRVARQCADPQEAVRWQRGLHRRLAEADHPYARQIGLGHMTEITELTDAERALLPVVREEWLQMGRAGRPADRDAAKAAISEIYRRCGLGPPSLWIWLGSPRAAAAAVLMLLRTRQWRPFHDKIQDCTDPESVHLRPLADPLLPQIEAQAGASRLPGGWEGLARHFGDLLWIQTGDRVASPDDSLVKYLFMAPLKADTNAEIRQQIRGNASAAIWEEIAEPIRWAIDRNFARTVELEGLSRIPGMSYQEGHWLRQTVCAWQRHASNLAAYDFLNRIQRMRGPERLEPLFALARSADLWWPFEHACILSERPAIAQHDAASRPDYDGGPALQYPDGWQLHAG